MLTSCFTACPAASVQPNALKVSAALFSHLKVSKALSASSSAVLYRIHTPRCIFSPSKSAHFVPAILEQSFRPPTSATTTSSIVFLDKGEKRRTLLGIMKDLPLDEGWVCLSARRWELEIRQRGQCVQSSLNTGRKYNAWVFSSVTKSKIFMCGKCTLMIYENKEKNTLTFMYRLNKTDAQIHADS